MKIMIVDDNKVFREAIRHMLKRNTTYEIVAEAENGEQALEVSAKQHLDLVLMDIEMPIMNGIEACKLMLYQNNSLKMIAITSYQDKMYLSDIIGAGFKAFVNKNNVFDELEEAISNAISGKIHIPKDLKLC